MLGAACTPTCRNPPAPLPPRNPAPQATKGKDSISFYTLPEFEEWREGRSMRGWTTKYYKAGAVWERGGAGWGWGGFPALLCWGHPCTPAGQRPGLCAGQL